MTALLMEHSACQPISENNRVNAEPSEAAVSDSLDSNLTWALDNLLTPNLNTEEQRIYKSVKFVIIRKSTQNEDCLASLRPASTDVSSDGRPIISLCEHSLEYLDSISSMIAFSSLLVPILDINEITRLTVAYMQNLSEAAAKYRNKYLTGKPQKNQKFCSPATFIYTYFKEKGTAKAICDESPEIKTAANNWFY